MAKANTDKFKAAIDNPPVVTEQGHKTSNPLEAILMGEGTKRRFSEVLGKKSAGFLSSLLSAYNTNTYLQECDLGSIMSSAMVAATLDLPINSNLGFAAIVPYKGKAQFQMMWKGFVQLCMRSGQYETINVACVYEGQLKSHNPFTGQMEFTPDEKKSDVVIGYVAYERLLNGFEKYCYITKENAKKHADKYSQSYKKGYGVWVDNFDAMGMKTAVKELLSKWGVMSVEMQKAVEFDQAVIVDDKPVYADNGGEIVDAEIAPSSSELLGEDKPAE